MNKRTILLVTTLIPLVIFNILFFAVGSTEHNVSGWTAYAWIHLAWIAAIAFSGSKNNSPSVNTPVTIISAGYFAAELVIGAVIILINSPSFIAGLVIQLVLLAVYIFLLVSNLNANADTNRNLQTREMQSDYIMQSSAAMKSVMNMVSDRTLYQKMELVYDILRSSPLSSTPSARDDELKVMESIELLRSEVANGNTDNILNAVKTVEQYARDRNLHNS